MIFHFGETPIQFARALPPGNWTLLLDSSSENAALRENIFRAGSMALAVAPRSFLVFENPSPVE
jgi:hypothetical protein